MTKTHLLTGARKQKVVIEYHDHWHGGPEWWVMFNDGHIESFDHAGAALKAVQKAAHRRNTSITITTIEWRNAPEGWTPPQ